ncbi:hypothetical protein, partial [Pseudomonas sp. PB120]|uniref:hypothetical protein n=1 Tax=Pseudomonas sp. PB120 TaxID=2494700 RepID=UPI001C4981CB
HPGTLPSGWLRCTYMQRVRLRRTALRATPRMNTSTQPPDGAGRSKSKAAGELTLGLLSGEERCVCATCFALCSLLFALCSLLFALRSFVGASLLAKNVQATRYFRHPASSFTTIASELAPTVDSVPPDNPFLPNIPTTSPTTDN